MAEPARDEGLELDPAETAPHPVVVVDAPTGRGLLRTCLVCVSGDDLGRSVGVGFQPIVIGRGRGDLSLSASDISRHHARISPDPDGYVLEDLGSANGTFLGGVQVTRPTRVQIGDRIQLGKTVLVFSHFDELEERMQHLQRLEAMGTMAGGIAHDFNNALAVILGNLDMVAEGLPPDAALAHECLAAIRGSATSAANLARRLLRLGSKEPLTIGAVGLTALIEQTLLMVRRRARAKHAIEIEVDPGLTVLGSFDELHQLLVNLYFNAFDAMPNGGRLRVSAHAVELDANEALLHQLATAGSYVELLVEDNGCGMDPVTRDRAFEPFFTTKPRGKGTGLGLAMIHGTVRRHGGGIELESEPGVGTVFRIFLHRRA